MTSDQFFSKRHYPDGVPIEQVSDLKRYPIDGLAGYNYTGYGLIDEDLVAVVDGHDSLIFGSCIDLFVNWIEVIRGLERIGKPYLDDPELGYAPVPGVPKTTMYLMFPRTDLWLKLKKAFDTRIGAWGESGKLRNLLERYISNGNATQIGPTRF